MDDPLEFEMKDVGVKQDLDTRAHLKDLHRKPELLAALGVDHVRAEMAWRYRFREVMQWERYFSHEIKEDFQGPLWKHDPDTNPIQSHAADAPHKPASGVEAEVDGAIADSAASAGDSE